MDRDEMLRVLRAFEREGLGYVLIGAAAMGFHGLVRATEALDVVIRATPENVERLKRALRIAYDDYPAVRYHPPSGDLYLDVLTRLGEMASFETVEAETKQVEGIRVRVAKPEALYRLKKGTLRPLDRQDAEALRRRFDLQEESVAVQRFRSLNEMNAAPITVAPGNGFERFARHCARYWAIAPRVHPRGVLRFRTLAEAQAARERVTDESVARRRAGS